jgi:hypothetical protein
MNVEEAKLVVLSKVTGECGCGNPDANCHESSDRLQEAAEVLLKALEDAQKAVARREIDGLTLAAQIARETPPCRYEGKVCLATITRVVQRIMDEVKRLEDLSR